MPVSIAQIMNQRAEVRVAVNQDFVTVVYNPSKFTPKFVAELAKSEESGELTNWLVTYLKELVLGWDLVLDEKKGGDPAPVDEATLGSLPFWFLRKLEEGMRAEMVPNAPNTSVSASIS